MACTQNLLIALRVSQKSSQSYEMAQERETNGVISGILMRSNICTFRKGKVCRAVRCLLAHGAERGYLELKAIVAAGSREMSAAPLVTQETLNSGPCGNKR